jgi:hypothetical protein
MFGSSEHGNELHDSGTLIYAISTGTTDVQVVKIRDA